MSGRKRTAILLAITFFLIAFGAAVAATVVQQVSRQIPSTLSLSAAVVISGDNLGLWHDKAKTQPVTSLEFTGAKLHPPLESRSIPEVWVYIENRSSIDLTLIAPCGDVESPPGTRIGNMDTPLFDIPTGIDLGNTCDKNVKLAPGQMVKANPHIHLVSGLASGDYSFTTVFGATGTTETAAPTAVQPPPVMVSWWPGDGNANDIMDGNHGTLSGDATFAQGMVGQGFSLDGTGDFVLVPDSSNLNITGDVTVDLWAKRTVFGSISVLVDKGANLVGTADQPDAYAMWFSQDDHLVAGFARADGSLVFLIGPVVTDTQFHHYSYVRSGNTHNLFVDGVVATADTFTGVPGDTSGLPLAIGAVRRDPNPPGFASEFGGIIDEVEVFNRALSAAEIKAIYDAGSAGKVKPPSAITSTFDTGDESWTVFGDAQGASVIPTYFSTGGNPGGYISATDDVTGGVWFWDAPAKLLGKVSSMRALSFDLKQSATDAPFDADDVVLVGAGTTLVFNTANNPGTDWTHYDVSLDASAGWKNKDTGQPATQQEMIDVLSSLAVLRIRGEYRDGADTGGLDNVRLAAS